MKIAINGFGRIGRSVFKAILERKNGLEIVAINDLSEPSILAELLQRDSVYGRYPHQVSSNSDNLIIDGKKYKVLAERDPKGLPWKEMGVDLVFECSGVFRTKPEALHHIKAGAKKVLISAPAKGEAKVKTIVLGVNEKDIRKTDQVLSMASCTTNCLAPMTKVMKDNFGVKKAIMTTVHAYTADQRLVDGPHKDLRRARAAAANIVPTTTGAAKAATETIPSLKGKFDGMAVRVPVLVGSLCDVVFITNKKVDEKKINTAFKKASRSAGLKGVLEATDEPLVSSDIIGNQASAIVDLGLTKVVDGDLVKVVAWYDNEWGYSCRMADLAEYLQKKKLV